MLHQLLWFILFILFNDVTSTLGFNLTKYLDTFPIDSEDFTLKIKRCTYEFEFSELFFADTELSKSVNERRLFVVMYSSSSISNQFRLPRLVYKSLSDGYWRTSEGFQINQIGKGNIHYTQETKVVRQIAIHLDHKKGATS